MELIWILHETYWDYCKYEKYNHVSEDEARPTLIEFDYVIACMQCSIVLSNNVKLLNKTIDMISNALANHNRYASLTPLPLVSHICVSESGQLWFTWWLDAYSGPRQYLNQCWVFVNWTIRNKLQWNFNQNRKLFIPENESKNIVCEMATSLSMGMG